MCVTLFSLRTGTDEITEYSGLYQKDPFLTLCLSLCMLSLGGLPPMAGFFGKLYLFWAGWQAGAYTLVLVGLVTSVISIYYYIRVIKMMVVKEDQEMSLAVQNYPTQDWGIPGMASVRVGMVVTVIPWGSLVLGGIRQDPWLISLGGLGIALQTGIRWQLQTWAGLPMRYLWLTWLGGLVTASIIVASVYKTLTGRCWTWRGRSLRLDQSGSP